MPDKGTFFENPLNAMRRLQQLQEHIRSNLSAVMTQKATSGFSLQEEPLPPQLTTEVRLLVYPQDPFVGAPEVRSMNADDIRPGLVNSRVKIVDGDRPPAQPDEDGHYLYWVGTPEFDQVNSFYYATFTLRMFERYAQRSIPWSFAQPRITVHPHVGDGANAFYSEHNQMLGFNFFQVDGQTVNAAQSADVVSHETAHAVLDGLRDLYNESFGLGPTAFHESFADMAAVLVALHDDSLITRLLEWTKGDLRIDNFIAVVAEELTTRLQSRGNHITGHTVYLRNALNMLRQISFDQLPYLPANPETELGRQAHNYSRLFTGAFYDMLVLVYEQLREEMAGHLALYRTRHIVGRILVCAVELAPVGEFDFADMARAFLSADNLLYDGEYRAVLVRVFAERGILDAHDAQLWTDSLATLPDLMLPDILNTGMASALFLEEKALPALKLPPNGLVPMNAYRNAEGLAYLTYFNTRRIFLEGTEYGKYNGSHIDAFGGLTLAFDAFNKLRSVIYRPVSDEDVRQIKLLTVDLIRHGMVADSLYSTDITPDKIGHGAQFILPVHPETVWTSDAPNDAAVESAGPTKLVKLPVIFDTLPRPVGALIDYLRAWQNH